MSLDVGTSTTPPADRYSAAIRSDADILSAIMRTADATASVAACPGWDVTKLVVHVGFIHRWATVAMQTGAAPERDAVTTPDDDENLAVWIVDGAAQLIAAISEADPQADTWHPFPVEQKMWVWPRRQALETAMHRWDAQTAVGRQASLDAELSAEGIAEYFEIGVPRVAAREGVTLPSQSLHVHCTDVDGEWLIWSEDGKFKVLPVHDKGDSAIRGTAADIWLLLMGRLDRTELDIVGDSTAADAWLDLPGW